VIIIITAKIIGKDKSLRALNQIMLKRDEHRIRNHYTKILLIANGDLQVVLFYFELDLSNTPTPV